MILQDLLVGLSPKLGFQRYVHHDINPVSGRVKNRQIANPDKDTRELHQRFLDYLRPVVREKLGHLTRYATACRPGCSPVKNASIHTGQRFFYQTDIRNAFPSVDGWRLAMHLATLDPELSSTKRAQQALAFERAEGVLTFLKRAFIEESGRGIIVGGPAANDLFNLFLGFDVDRPIHELITSPGYAPLRVVYTRYTDDLTFSARKPIPKQFRRAVRLIIEQAGFAVNHRKSVVSDIRIHPVEITGVSLSADGRMFVPRRYLTKISGLISYALRSLRQLDEDARKSVLGRVEGMMGVFWALHSRNRNKTEQRVVDAYERLRLFSEPVARA